MIQQEQRRQLAAPIKPTLPATPAAPDDPPPGYSILAKGAWRQAGDMIYNQWVGWLVCGLSTGTHPEEARVARRRIQNTTTGMNDHAPLRMNKEPDWIRHATPLYYTVLNPFSEKDDDVLMTFALKDLRAAITAVKDPETSYSFLYVHYLDHSDNTFRAQKLMWVSYESEPTHTDPKAMKRVIHDPCQIICY